MSAHSASVHAADLVRYLSMAAAHELDGRTQGWAMQVAIESLERVCTDLGLTLVKPPASIPLPIPETIAIDETSE